METDIELKVQEEYKNDPLVTAAKSYLKTLQQKNCYQSYLMQRKLFLEQILSQLLGQPFNKIMYDQIVNKVISTNYQSEEIRHFFSTTARDFFPFASHDIKTIARMVRNDNITVNPVKFSITGNLPEIMDQILAFDTDSLAGKKTLDRYLAILEHHGYPDIVLNSREMLLTILLWIIRTHKPTRDVYRAGVDALSTLFTGGVNDELYTAIREYFHFWVEEENAESYITPYKPKDPTPTKSGSKFKLFG